MRPWDCAWHYPGDPECYDADERDPGELEALWMAGGPLSDEAIASGDAWERAWAESAE
jgi:hypothetical protein